MAGSHSDEFRKEEAERKAQWMIDNGYEGKEHVLDYPKGTRKDWAKDSPEMALRIEIHHKYEPIRKANERPYQDVWHWLLDNAFYELSNDSVCYLDETSYDKGTPDYVITVLNAIAAEVPADHPARQHGSINFYVYW